LRLPSDEAGDGTISANSIGNIIADATEQVGMEGVITVEAGNPCTRGPGACGQGHRRDHARPTSRPA
jgi:hypothetical protein